MTNVNVVGSVFLQSSLAQWLLVFLQLIKCVQGTAKQGAAKAEPAIGRGSSADMKWKVMEAQTVLLEYLPACLLPLLSTPLKNPSACFIFSWWPSGSVKLEFNISLVDQPVKDLPETQDTWVWSLGQEDPQEKGKATCSSPGKFLGQRSLVGYSSWDPKEADTTNWVTNTWFTQS